MIRIHGLTKRFGEIQALRGLSFEAQDGEITGLLGSNGAGKTTALRILCGVLRPDSGCAQVDGISTTGDPIAAQRKLGAVLDHMGLYGGLTAKENLEYFANLRGQKRSTAEEIISLLGLESIAERRTVGFSQGERMKTALGRALVHNPNNVVLDEPTNGLDIPSVRSLRGHLRRLRDRGACVVFSSHMLEEVRALCDKVVVIACGRVAACGTVEELTQGGASFEDAFVRLAC